MDKQEGFLGDHLRGVTELQQMLLRAGNVDLETNTHSRSSRPAVPPQSRLTLEKISLLVPATRRVHAFINRKTSSLLH